MGCYSWKYCDATKEKKRMICGLGTGPSFLLIPKEFGGGHLKEIIYDGYGNMAGVDIYEAVAMWNREYLSQNPDHILPHLGKKVSAFSWYPIFADLSIPFEELAEALEKEGIFSCEINGEPVFELRKIGIAMACYDVDNASLKYPVKIACKEESVYEKCKPSKSDPLQGCY